MPPFHPVWEVLFPVKKIQRRNSERSGTISLGFFFFSPENSEIEVGKAADRQDKYQGHVLLLQWILNHTTQKTNLPVADIMKLKFLLDHHTGQSFKWMCVEIQEIKWLKLQVENLQNEDIS